MAGLGPGVRRGFGCLTTSSVAVGAAVVGHVSAGGARPATHALVLLLLGLAGLLALLPRRLRTLRAQLMAAAVLQPVLHVVFELAPAGVSGPSRSVGAGLVAMVLAHAATGLAAVWVLRHADRVVAAGADLARLLVQLIGLLVPPAPARPKLLREKFVRPLAGRVVASSLRRRGPPAGHVPALSV